MSRIKLPDFAPPKVRTLAEMTPEERAEMERRYSPPTPKDNPKRKAILPTARWRGRR